MKGTKVSGEPTCGFSQAVVMGLSSVKHFTDFVMQVIDASTTLLL